MSDCAGPIDAHEPVSLRFVTSGNDPHTHGRGRIECTGCGRLVLANDVSLRIRAGGYVEATVTMEFIPVDIIARINAVQLLPTKPRRVWRWFLRRWSNGVERLGLATD